MGAAHRGVTGIMIVSHLSTEQTPEAERLTVWRDFLGRKLLRVNIDPLPESRFFIDATLHRLPGLSVVSASSSGAISRRTSELIDGEDQIVLNIIREGVCVVTQRGKEVGCGPGAAIAMSATEPCTVLRPANARVLTVSLPRQALAPFMSDSQAAVMRPIPAGSPMLKLLTHYLDTMPVELLQEDAELQQVYVRHTYELLALAMTPGAMNPGAMTRAAMTGGAAARSVTDKGLRAARLQAARHHIETHLHEPGLTPLGVAMAVGISLRQLHQLFAGMETSVMRYVLARRLEHARHMLATAAERQHSIADIAFHSGFDSLATFYRVFKKAYGLSPADYRAAHNAG